MRSQTTARKAPAKTILLVDDDAAVREMIGRVLLAEGYQVRTAASGEEALAAAAAQPIDLVLLDLNLPGKGGWDIFAELTTRDPVLAVIIITAKPNQLFTSLGAGVGALLEKPLDFPVVLRTISALLAESGQRRLERLTGRTTDLHDIKSDRRQF